MFFTLPSSFVLGNHCRLRNSPRDHSFLLQSPTESVIKIKLCSLYLQALLLVDDASHKPVLKSFLVDDASTFQHPMPLFGKPISSHVRLKLAGLSGCDPYAQCC